MGLAVMHYEMVGVEAGIIIFKKAPPKTKYKNTTSPEKGKFTGI